MEFLAPSLVFIVISCLMFPLKQDFNTSFLLNPDFSICPKMGSSVSIYLSPMFNSLVDIFWIQGVLYGSVGFGCGLIGQGIANMIMNAKRYASIRIIILLIYPKYIYIYISYMFLFLCLFVFVFLSLFIIFLISKFWPQGEDE